MQSRWKTSSQRQETYPLLCSAACEETVLHASLIVTGHPQKNKVIDQMIGREVCELWRSSFSERAPLILVRTKNKANWKEHYILSCLLSSCLSNLLQQILYFFFFIFFYFWSVPLFQHSLRWSFWLPIYRVWIFGNTCFFHCLSKMYSVWFAQRVCDPSAVWHMLQKIK